MKENSCVQNCWRITCEVTISIAFLLGKSICMQPTFIDHVWSDVRI
jgi:hypothetical protein